MSTSIESVSFGDGDTRRLVLSNSQVARVIDIGTNWTQLRIGYRIAMDDSGGNLTGTPLWYTGVLASPASGMSNGPLGSTTSHFVGQASRDSTWTRLTGPVRYQVGGTGTGMYRAVKKVGAVFTGVNFYGTPVISAEPGTYRTIVTFDVIKGSPNFFTHTAFCTAVADRSLTILQNVMEILDYTALDSYITAEAGGGTWGDQVGTGSGVAVNEGTDGALNAICVAWNRTTPVMRISEIYWSKIS